MGYSLKEFTEVFDEVTDEEINELDKNIDVRDYFRGLIVVDCIGLDDLVFGLGCADFTND